MLQSPPSVFEPLNGKAQASPPLMVPDLTDWLNQGTIPASKKSPASVTEIPLGDRGSALELSGIQHTQKTKYLRFRLSANETALITLADIREILKIPQSTIVKVPHMPPGIRGIYNCRGEILWLVDLLTQLGLHNTLPRESQHSLQQPLAKALNPKAFNVFLTALWLEVDEQSLGVIIPEVIDIEEYDLSHLKPPNIDLFPPWLLPFVMSYCTEMNAPVLSTKAILNDPQLQIHR
jgi:positive phototaxis protein PixI